MSSDEQEFDDLNIDRRLFNTDNSVIELRTIRLGGNGDKFTFTVIKCSGGYNFIQKTLIYDLIDMTRGEIDEKFSSHYTVFVFEEDQIPYLRLGPLTQYVKAESFIYILENVGLKLKYRDESLKYFCSLIPPELQGRESEFRSVIMEINDMIVKQPRLCVIDKVIHKLYKLKKVGDHVEWIDEFINLMIDVDYSEAYKIIGKFGEKVAELNIMIPILNIVVFLKSKIQISETMIANPSLRFSTIYDVKSPHLSPLQLLSLKRLRTRTRNLKMPRKEDTELTRFKIIKHVLDHEMKPSVVRVIFSKPNIINSDSFKIENTGKNFKRIYESIRTQALFNNELAAREVLKRDDVFANLLIG